MKYNKNSTKNLFSHSQTYVHVVEVPSLEVRTKKHQNDAGRTVHISDLTKSYDNVKYVKVCADDVVFYCCCCCCCCLLIWSSIIIIEQFVLEYNTTIHKAKIWDSQVHNLMHYSGTGKATV